jgi:hypothetical protein
LTYSTPQRSLAESLHAKLCARGFRVFFDKSTLGPAESFDDRILCELQGSDVLVFLVSPDSVASGRYALTELGYAQAKWPNPRGRVLPVMAVETALETVPAYLRDNVDILRIKGNFATEVANAVVAIRSRRRRAAGGWAAAVLLAAASALAIASLKVAVSPQARIRSAVVSRSLENRVYTDACLELLPSFARYPTSAEAPPRCDRLPDFEQAARGPLLVVGQPATGKKATLERVQHLLGTKQVPSVLVSWRDCARKRKVAGRDAPSFRLEECLADEIQESPEIRNVDRADVLDWVRRQQDYVLLFDAVDDSGSALQTFTLIEDLYKHYQGARRIVISARPEILRYVFDLHGLEPWALWLREQVPTLVVRGIPPSSIERVASAPGHEVPGESLQPVLALARECPDAGPQLREWLTHPKLFRGQGEKSVMPVARAIAGLGVNGCAGWRGPVLTEMIRARIWAYCHDELCGNWRATSEQFLSIARQLRGRRAIEPSQLEEIARNHGLTAADDLAFTLLGIGVLTARDGRLEIVEKWIPEA